MSRFLPKSVVCLREGYTRARFLNDLAAGVTVGIIALPLAMAFGIASIPGNVAAEAGISPPAVGLFTAVVAGFLISALGGSRVQIGGPTGAFIVIVYHIAAKHGYDGLATATLMAGVIVILMGVFRFGGMIKFIPYPVTTGFTSGIAVLIAASQIKDFFGLQMHEVPAEFVEKLQAALEYAPTCQPATLGIGVGSLMGLILLRRLVPRIPGAIVVIILAAAVTALWHLPVETIGSKFGGVPRSLPMPRMPAISFDLIRQLVPEATTIAILAAIESLLSAVVADGMTGGRHKADCELVAQGIANVGSVLFGGIPATGAIARTTANIKTGGATPLAGMVHAITLLVIMLLLAPAASLIPLASLAAVLLMVAWNMSEIDHFRYILRAPRGDALVMLTTFGLTVFTDLTIAVGVGMVLAAMLFLRRMAEVSNVSAITREFEDVVNGDETGPEGDPDAISARHVPEGVEVYEINGPFFFGVADRLKDTLSGLERPPKVFILRMRKVTVLDASGLHALEEFHRKCTAQGTVLLLSGVHAQPLRAFIQVGFDKVVRRDHLCGNIDTALARARELVGETPATAPA